MLQKSHIVTYVSTYGACMSEYGTSGERLKDAKDCPHHGRISLLLMRTDAHILSGFKDQHENECVAVRSTLMRATGQLTSGPTPAAMTRATMTEKLLQQHGRKARRRATNKHGLVFTIEYVSERGCCNRQGARQRGACSHVQHAKLNVTSCSALRSDNNKHRMYSCFDVKKIGCADMQLQTWGSVLRFRVAAATLQPHNTQTCTKL